MIGSFALSQPMFDGFITDKFVNEKQPIYYLENLNRVNIFVGANNSGKSRFMRHMVKTNLSVYTLEEQKILEAFGKEFVENYQEIVSNNQIIHFSECDILYEKIVSGKEAKNYWSMEALKLAAKMSSQPHNVSFRITRKLPNSNSDTKNYPPASIYTAWLKSIRDKNPEYGSVRTDDAARMENFKNLFSKKLYIPTIRSLRSFENLIKKDETKNGNDIFRKRIACEYFSEKDSVEIFTGLTLFEELTQMLLGSHSQRKAVRDFEIFLKDNFFYGQDVTLVPKYGKDVVTVKIGNEQEREIHQLGDGVQSIIILTFPLFKFKDESMLVLIEEPEIYMHPGIQRIFLDTITKEFPKHQFFITTHSNHFIDLTMDYGDISIFAFSKCIQNKKIEEQSPSFQIEALSHNSFRPMELLGVRNSSVLLSNCTIWVEGITDRLYLGHYLDLYQETLIEQPNFKPMRRDFEYSFVEYGGNNITHWSFLDDGENETIDTDRLCGKLFLVTDKDSKKKEPRHEKLAEKLGERYYCLECSEIENLLSPEVLVKVIENYEGKSINKTLKQKSYTNQKLGKFIDKWLKDEKHRKGSYASKSGTVTDKLNFCKKAIDWTSSFEDLSHEAQVLTQKIYDFIVSNNR
jgi:predicted ATP-dependent endonuclease of OLD family